MDMTIYQLFEKSVRDHGENEAVAVLRGPGYHAMTYRELDARVIELARGLSAIAKKGDRLAIMLMNGPEWVMVDLACARLGIVLVPIHASYNWHYASYIINDCNATVLVMHDSIRNKFHEHLSELHVDHVVIVDAHAQDIAPAIHFASMFDTTKTTSMPEVQIRPDDVHTVVYTSGTTGNPRGVMLSHANLISNALGAKEAVTVYPSDRFFSFLPLSHILERTVGHYIPILSGSAIYYSRGVKTLTDDLKLAQPTIIVSVPRIFERVHEKILAKFSRSSFLDRIFKKALQLGYRKQRQTLSILDRIEYAFFDVILFSKVRSAFGGRLRFAVSGGASLAKHVAEFFEAMNILVIEGYGLTESAPIITTNTLKKYKFGTVGLVIRGTEVMIDQSGEILARGSGIMKGYLNAPDMTKEVIDPDGWLHTGDLGSLDSEGFLTIIGRRKEMIVLTTGKNILPVPIEQALEESKYILQAMVYGDNQRSIAAIIVPQFDALKEWCQSQGIEYTLPDVLTDQHVINFYREHITEHLVHFQSFEQVRDFKLVSHEFTVENDLLTPSQKLRRSKIFDFFCR